MPPTAERLLADFGQAIARFERGCMDLCDAEGAEQARRDAYAKAEDAGKRLKLIQDYMKSRLGFKKDVPIVTGGGASLQAKWGKTRKTWNHEGLKPVVIEKILAKHIDPETGTINAPPSVIMGEVFDCVSFSSWKVTVIRDLLGVDPEDFCITEPGHMNVIVRFPNQTVRTPDAESD